MELPSCEAINVTKVNIGSIVKPVTKFKADNNFKIGTDLKVITDFKTGTKQKAGTHILTLKLVATSKVVVCTE